MKRLHRFRSYGLLFWMMLWLLALPARGQLELLPDEKPQWAFAGETGKISLVWHNIGRTPVEVEIRTRLYQASAATAMPISEQPGKACACFLDKRFSTRHG